MSGMRRVLAHRVVHAGRVYRLAIADISGPEIVVEPFSVETAGTPFAYFVILSQRAVCIKESMVRCNQNIRTAKFIYNNTHKVFQL